MSEMKPKNTSQVEKMKGGPNLCIKKKLLRQQSWESFETQRKSNQGLAMLSITIMIMLLHSTLQNTCNKFNLPWINVGFSILAF